LKGGSEMDRADRITRVGTPFVFGMLLIISGIVFLFIKPELAHGVYLIGAGLVCVSLYCTCSLLAKIIEKIYK